MAIEINVNKATTTVDMSVAQDNAPAAQSAKETPILGGDSLTVTSGATTDLEKLVAQLKNESETIRQNVAQRRVALLQTVLDSMADKVTETEKENLLEIEKLGGQKGELEKELAGLNGDKKSTEGRITALDIEIAKLEKQIELAVEDGADHRERVAELKAQRAKEQEKLRYVDLIPVDERTVVLMIVADNGEVSNTTVRLEGFEDGEHVMTIHNSYGVELFRLTFNGIEKTLDMSNMPQGQYMISVDGVAAKAMQM